MWFTRAYRIDARGTGPPGSQSPPRSTVTSPTVTAGRPVGLGQCRDEARPEVAERRPDQGAPLAPAPAQRAAWQLDAAGGDGGKAGRVAGQHPFPGHVLERAETASRPGGGRRSRSRSGC